MSLCVVCCCFGCRPVFVMCGICLSLFVVACFDRSGSSLTCVVRCCLWSLVAFDCCVLFVGVCCLVLFVRGLFVVGRWSLFDVVR